jgi:hypothetical protein
MQQGGWRANEGYHEADTVFRKNASESFDFVPGETKAVNKGEISCYRQAANLSSEIVAVREAKRISAVDPAQEVINRSRQCAKFFPYEPGVDPPGHLVEEKATALEDDRRRFEKTLADFQMKLSARDARQNWRLAAYALIVTLMRSGMGICDSHVLGCDRHKLWTPSPCVHADRRLLVQSDILNSTMVSPPTGNPRRIRPEPVGRSGCCRTWRFAIARPLLAGSPCGHRQPQPGRRD